MGHKEDRRLKLYRGTWCVVWRENGQTKRHSLRTKQREIALRNFEEYKNQINRKHDTINDIITLYLEARYDASSYKSMVNFAKKASRFFGDYLPHQINEAMCKKYHLKRGKKTASVRNELLLLRAACNYFDKNNTAVFWIPNQVAPRDRRITKDELRLLIDNAISPHVRLFIILASTTAARVTALLELTWDQVDFENERITLTKDTGKKQKRRAVVKMNNTLKLALIDAYTARTCDYVIEYGSERITTINKGFRNAVQRAGLEKISPHVLRHSAACWMAESGIPIDEIAQFLGHTNSKITYSTYARYSPEYLASAAQALEI